jgi:hypothetical protein
VHLLHNSGVPHRGRNHDDLHRARQQQSEQIGELRGERRGEQKGEARLLLRLVGLKYGEVPDDARRRIEAADAETLLIWSDRILTAQHLDKVLR